MIWTTASTYHLGAPPGSEIDLLAGARLLDMRQTLARQTAGNLGNLPLAWPSGKVDVGINNWDAIAGAKGRADLGTSGKWIVPFDADIGDSNEPARTQRSSSLVLGICTCGGRAGAAACSRAAGPTRSGHKPPQRPGRHW